MLRLFLCVSVFIIMLAPLSAQQELSLHMMRDVSNATLTNPALVSPNRIVIGLPSAYFNYYHSAGSINELIKKRDGKTVLDVNELIRLADPQNQLDVNLELQTLYFQYRLNNIALSLHHAVKSNTFINYPKTLPQLFWQGNSQFVGQTIEFGPEQQSFAYNEIGAGIAYESNGWTIGARGKLLLGIGDISTERNKASLFTSDDIYQLTLESDYLINASVFDSRFVFDSLDNVGIEYNWKDITSFSDGIGANTGFAVDLGIRYRWNDKLDVAFSVVDLGKINWTKKVSNYNSQGVFEYDGLDFSNIFTDENLSFQNTVDTIEEIFQFNETSNSYSTKLAAKIYASALYQLTESLQVGAMYYQENFRGRTSPALALSARKQFFEKASIGLIYAIRNDRFDNLGINGSVKFGPVQVFAHTDNILAAFKAYNSENVNFRAGLNILLF